MIRYILRPGPPVNLISLRLFRDRANKQPTHHRRKVHHEWRTAMASWIQEESYTHPPFADGRGMVSTEAFI
jgi:hypothetical protein